MADDYTRARHSFYKSQNEFISHLHKKTNQINSIFSVLSNNGIISSIVSNLSRLDIKKAYKAGFIKLEIINREGYKRQIMVRMANANKPLAIFVAGIGLSVDMHSFCEFAIPLAKNSDYNIILVENSTSGEWVSRNYNNMRTIASGYESGWDLYLSLLALRQHPLINQQYSSLHLIGLSLGGNDATFTAYFDSILQTNIITGGILAWSAPLNRFYALSDFMKLSGVLRILVRILFEEVYRKGKHIFCHYSDKNINWLFRNGSNIENLLHELYLESSQIYFQQQKHHFLKTTEVKKIHLSAPKGLISYSSFKQLFCLSHYLPHINKPVLFIHSSNDPMVFEKRNTNYIKNYKLSKYAKIVTFPIGGHLGFSCCYGRKWIINTIKKYIEYWS